MGDAAGSPKTGVDVGGAMQFVAGGLLGTVIFAVTVGLPGLVALLLSERFGGSSIVAMVIAALVGAVLCAAIGNALGRRPEVNWWFAGSVVIGPAYMSLTAIRAAMQGADAWALVAVGGYALAGLAFVAGFFVGHKRTPTADEESASVTE